MIFRSLVLENFKSFTDPQTFHFPGSSGFYFLTGKNLVNPEVGRNAVGKSSLWDGLLWTLYGRTARGLKASDVISWGEGGGITSGRVEFLQGGRYHALTRTQSPNSLTIERKNKKPRTVTQDEIDQLVGLTYHEFLATVLMGQFNQFFFDLSPADKLTTFTSVLGLKYWSEKSAKAMTLASEHEAKYIKLDRELEGVRERIRVLTEELISAQKEEKEFQRERKSKLKQLAEEFDQHKLEISRIKLRLVVIETEIAQLAEWEAREGTTSIAALEDDLTRQRAAKTDLDKQTAKAESERNRAEEAQKLASEARCSTCSQPIANRQQRMEQATKVMREARTRWLDLDGQARKAGAAIDRTARCLAELRKQSEAHRSQLAQLKSDQDRLTDQLENFNARKAACREKYREMKAGGSPALARCKKIDVALRHSRFRLSQAGRLLPFHAARRDGGQFWHKEFRNLRLWLVEEALRQLEVEVGNSLLQLGLRGWKVTFDIERATKSGTVSKGFNVFVQSPDSDGPVRWESWSGGETQRLRVAGAIGLSNLIRARRGFDCNLEVWDEPTAGLSREGISDLLSFFESRADEEDRQIWLIDHRALSHDFTGEVVIEKTAAGSLIHSGRWSHGVQR